MAEFKVFPNLEATLGTTVPLVTSLLAATTTALLAIPLTSTTPSPRLGRLRWTEAQVAVSTSALALAGFVIATTAAVWAQASAVGSLTDAQLARSGLADGLRGRPPSDEALLLARERYGQLVAQAYGTVRVFWQAGVGLLIATVGVLAHPKVPIALPLGGLGGALAIVRTTDERCHLVRKGALWLLALALVGLATSTLGA